MFDCPPPVIEEVQGAVQAVQEGQLVGNQEEEGQEEGATGVTAGVEVAEDPILEVGLEVGEQEEAQ